MEQPPYLQLLSIWAWGKHGDRRQPHQKTKGNAAQMGAEVIRILKSLFSIHPDLRVGIGSRRWFTPLGVLGIMGTGLIGTGSYVLPDFGPEREADLADTPATLAIAEPFNNDIPVDLAIVEPVLVPEPEPVLKSVTVGRGDTLARLLDRNGVPRQPAYHAIQALSKNFDVRRLQVGQEVNLVLDPTDETQLLALSVKPDVDRIVTSSRHEDGSFYSDVEMLPLDKVMIRAEGRIDDSLYMAMDRAGVAPEIIAELIMIYSFDVDFQREIRQGDAFELFYEQYLDETGAVAKHGDILFGNLTLRGKPLNLYRYVTSDDDKIDYYNEHGHSVRKALLRTPIDGARLTSRFGKRRHPLLGYTKMHKGIDFGARRGTPIRAAGDGVVERASRYGSFGNYALIRHSSEFKTAYAHMKGFARGMKKGAKVKQGQIIGYVGTTGRSTGPHLHYEVLKNGKHVNPLSLKLPSGRRLEGEELKTFQTMLAERQVAMANTPVMTQLAASAPAATTAPAAGE